MRCFRVAIVREDNVTPVRRKDWNVAAGIFLKGDLSFTSSGELSDKQIAKGLHLSVSAFLLRFFIGTDEEQVLYRRQIMRACLALKFPVPVMISVCVLIFASGRFLGRNQLTT